MRYSHYLQLNKIYKCRMYPEKGLVPDYKPIKAAAELIMASFTDA
jgi:hypothetical protein